MKSNVWRALAAATICATVTGTLAASPFAATDQTQPNSCSHKLTNFGLKGTAAGVRLVTGNVETLSVADAVAPLRCTRMAGRSNEQSSVLSAPENSLINLSASTSRTITYRHAGRVGVLAVNHLGDITIGGDLGGQPTPVVTLKGLTTTADAFHTAKGYGHHETFDYSQFGIELPEATPIPPELQDLLDAIQTQVIDQVIQVLQDAGPRSRSRASARSLWVR